ncbi:MAG: hypothetical protein RSC68_25100 [Acinetobacter sp.]
MNFEKHTTWLASLWAFFSGLFAQWTFNDYGAIVNPLRTEATKLAARQDAADLTAAVKSKTAETNAGMHADMPGDMHAHTKESSVVSRAQPFTFGEFFVRQVQLNLTALT